MVCSYCSVRSMKNFTEIIQVSNKQNQLKHLHFEELNAAKTLTELLKKGLNKRVTHLVPLIFFNEPWNFGEKPKAQFNKILIGVNLSAEHAFSRIEIGPDPNTEEAKRFREFWGALATLRR